jgi:hypothetical protein
MIHLGNLSGISIKFYFKGYNDRPWQNLILTHFDPLKTNPYIQLKLIFQKKKIHPTESHDVKQKGKVVLVSNYRT